MENIMSKVTNLEYKKTDVWQHFSQDKANTHGGNW